MAHQLPTFVGITEALDSHLAHCAKDQAYRMLEEQLRVTRAAMIHMNSRWNELSAICKIPTELLTEILCLVVDGASWKTHVQISSICKHWRFCALDSPGYWAHVPFLIANDTYSMDMLRRAKDFPRILHLVDSELPHGVTVSRATFEFQFDCSKLVELDIQVKGLRVAQITEYLPRGTAPRLRRMRISWDGKPLPMNVFRCSMPALRHLDLRRCAIPWHHIEEYGCFHRDLLSFSLISPTARCPTPLLLSILGSSPKLEELVLEDALHLVIEPMEDHPMVSLLSLRTCSVTDYSAPSFVNFYTSIAWSHSAAIDAQLRLSRPGAYVAFLDACRSTGFDQKITTLQINTRSSGTMYAPGLKCYFTGMNRAGDGSRLAAAGITKLVLDSLIHHLNATEEEIAGTWRQFFRRHASVERLEIRGHLLQQSWHVFDRLGYEPPHAGGQEHPILLPNLKRLSLSKTSMNERSQVSFLDMLASRIVHGMPQLKLEIKEVGGFNVIAERVEGMVGKDRVAWNKS